MDGKGLLQACLAAALYPIRSGDHNGSFESLNPRNIDGLLRLRLSAVALAVNGSEDDEDKFSCDDSRAVTIITAHAR